MSSEPTSPPVSPAPLAALDRTMPVTLPQRQGLLLSRGALLVFFGLLLLALAASGLLWQRLGNIQQQLARQSADSGANAIEARAMARQAQELARETAARQAGVEARLAEVALQRGQLEQLIQSLSLSRDENLAVDIESALRLAQQQAQLTGSIEPLLAALRTADQRLARAAQPRLSRLRAALGRDIHRLQAAGLADLPGLTIKLDELVRQVDELPLANAVTPPPPAASASRQGAPELLWWQRAAQLVRQEARALVRVSRIDQPEAVLLAPEQAFFLRENLKLKLLNARLSLLARQTDSARGDVAAAAVAVGKYFDPASRKTQLAAVQLKQINAQLRAVELPRIDETLALLATAAAGR